MFFCIGKHFSNHSRGFTNVFIDNLRLASFERSEKRVAVGMKRCSLEDLELEKTKKGNVVLDEMLGAGLGVEGIHE